LASSSVFGNNFGLKQQTQKLSLFIHNRGTVTMPLSLFQIILALTWLAHQAIAWSNVSYYNLFNDRFVDYVIHWNNDPVLKSSLSSAFSPLEPGKAPKDEAASQRQESTRNRGLRLGTGQSHSIFPGMTMTPPPFYYENNGLPELLFLTDAWKTQFVCAIPPMPPSLGDQKGNLSMKHTTTASPRQLLEGLQSVCLYKVVGWWTYELCHERYVRQFHSLSIDDRALEVYHLGYFNPILTELQKSPSRHGKARYFSQYFTDGSTCDINGKPRGVEVRYFCGHDETDYIDLVKEIGYCRYEIHVRTPRLCSLPEYSSPENNYHILDIQCHPLVDNLTQDAKIHEMYTDYILPGTIRIGSRLDDDEMLEMRLDSSRRAKLSTSESSIPAEFEENNMEFKARSASYLNPRIRSPKDPQRAPEKRTFDSIDEMIDMVARKIMSMAFDDDVEISQRMDDLFWKGLKSDEEEQYGRKKDDKSYQRTFGSKKSLRNLRSLRETSNGRRFDSQQSLSTPHESSYRRPSHLPKSVDNDLPQDAENIGFKQPLQSEDSLAARDQKGEEEIHEDDDYESEEDSKVRVGG
jgi:hypothetical protein